MFSVFIKINILFFLRHKILRFNIFRSNTVPIYGNIPQHFTVNTARLISLYKKTQFHVMFSAELVLFHKISTPGNWVKLQCFTQPWKISE